MKERICEYIQQEDYIKSLLEVMVVAEAQENLENLHALCSLMQTIRKSPKFFDSSSVLIHSFIVMLNDHSMYEHILEDDLFLGVVGMLECTYFYFPDSHYSNPNST